MMSRPRSIWGRSGRLAGALAPVLSIPALAALALLGGAGPASATTVSVCRNGCAYTQLPPALAAAQDGDTITVGPGTYAGDVTIDLSVRLVGAGAGVTVIRGGGPVLTIGVPGASKEPTVTIEGVTVTGGAAIGNLTPSSGRGGGIYIPRAAGPSTGATVLIRNSVIRDNLTAPRVAVESDDACCLFADSGGGGISNDGVLTLDHTLVSGNRADDASGLASNAVGGGILNRAFGRLTVKNSTVTGNRARVSAPNGRFTSGGGIEAVGGTITVVDSRVDGNSVTASMAEPVQVEESATGGGIHLQEAASTTIRGTAITGNRITSTNSLGNADAFSGGLHVNGPLVLSDSTVSGNRVVATAVAGRADVDSGGAEINVPGTISRTRFTGNSARAASSTGVAHARAGGIQTAAFDQLTIRDSQISGNRLTATTTAGSSSVQGGGLGNFGLLTVKDSGVEDNTAAAGGPGTVAQGGGVYVGSFPDGPPSVRLGLAGSSVTGNILIAGPGGTVQGGGVFALFPVTSTDSVIGHNVPDQCVGC